MRRVLSLLILVACVFQVEAQLSVLPGDTSICAGDSVTFTASGMTTYSFQDTLNSDSLGGSSYTFTTLVAGSHELIVRGYNAAVDSDTVYVMITVNNPPTVNAVLSEDSICQGDTTQLVAETVGTINSYAWAPSATLNSTTNDTVLATPNAPTTYYVTVTDGNECTAVDSAFVYVFQPAISIMSSAGTSICEGSSSELIAMGSGLNSFLWSPAGSLDTTTLDTVIATPDTTTTYYLVASDTNGCSGMDSVTISVNPAPSVSVESSAEVDNNYVCLGNSATLTATADSTVVSYEWSPVATLNDSVGSVVEATPLVNTTYSVLVTDSNGCTASSTKLVRVSSTTPSVQFVAEDTELCQGESTFIDLLTTGTIFSWTPTNSVDDPTSEDVTVTPTTTTNYFVNVRNNGCDTTASIQITVLPAPSLVLAQTSGASTICLDEVAEFTATCPNCVSYLWTMPNSSLATLNNVQNISPNSVGVVTVKVKGTDAETCSSVASINVTVDDCYVGDPFSVESIDEAEVKVLTKSDVIVFQSNIAIERMQVYNILGERIHQAHSISSSSSELPTASLASGMYIVEIALADGTQLTEKVYIR